PRPGMACTPGYGTTAPAHHATKIMRPLQSTAPAAGGAPPRVLDARSRGGLYLNPVFERCVNAGAVRRRSTSARPASATRSHCCKRFHTFSDRRPPRAAGLRSTRGSPVTTMPFRIDIPPARRAAFFLSLALVVAVPAQAQTAAPDTSRVYELEQVVVTADRSAQALATSAA